MTTDVELLPLPDWMECLGEVSAAHIRDYARANMEPLIKERDFLVTEYERAVGCGPQGYLHAAMHLFNAITNAQVDQNSEAIVALLAENERLAEALAYVLDTHLPTGNDGADANEKARAALDQEGGNG